MKPQGRVTRGVTFFDTSSEGNHLFEIRKGVNLDHALNALYCYLDTAKALTCMAAHAVDSDGLNGVDHDSRIVYAAHYLVEMSCAIALSALHADDQEQVETSVQAVKP